MKTTAYLVGLFASAAFVCLEPSASATVTVINYWRMGEADRGASPGAAAVTAVDSAGTNNLTYSGAATYSSDVAVCSNFTSTLSVDFTNSAYALGSIPTTVQDNFGIEAWVNPTASGSGGVILYNGSTATSGWGIFIDSSKNAYAGLFGGVDIPGDQQNSATNGVWADVALVRQNGVATLYVNGVPQPYQSTATPNTPSGNLAIACAPQAPGQQTFTGLVDEARIFTFAPGQFYTTDLWTSPPLPPSGEVTNRLALGTTNLIENGTAGTDSVTLNDTLPVNSWTATANSSWLHLSAGSQSGAGDALIVFSFDANPGPVRTGSLTIAGQTVSVTQAPANFSPAQLVNAVLPQLPLPSPNAIAVDSQGDIYVCNGNYSLVWEWTASNQTVANLTIPGLAQPNALAVDSSGNLYMITYPNYTPAVQEWNPATQTLTTLAIPNLNSPDGLAVDGAGNVYVADPGQPAVVEWSPVTQTTSNIITSIGYPQSVAVDSLGNVYVLDGNNVVVDEWSSSNQTLTTLPISLLNSPVALACDANNNLYISDFNFNNYEGDIIQWNPSTQTATEFLTNISYTYGLAFDGSGDLYLTGSGGYDVAEYTAAGQTLVHLVMAGPDDPTGYAVDSSNNLYMADQYGGAVEKWSAASNAYSLLITSNIQYPSAVALDAVGNIYVTDTSSNAVLEFNPSGVYIATLVSNLNNPYGLAVDAAGDVYVADSGNNQILEWIAASNNTLVVVPPSAGLNFPCNIALGAIGNIVYIADDGNSRVVAWNPVSQTLTPLWSLGYPVAVAVDGSGNVYSQDNYSGEFERWQPWNNAVVNLGQSPDYSAYSGIALDSAGDIFATSTTLPSQVAELPHVLLPTRTIYEGPAAGSAALPPIVPSNFDLTLPPFQPATDQPWLSITGVTNGVVDFAWTADPGIPRTGNIEMLGCDIPVTQNGGFSIGTSALLEGPQAGSDSEIIAVLAPPIAWTATANVPWLHISNSNGTASATMIFSFDANTGGQRSGTISINELILTVTQAPIGYQAATGPATPLVFANLSGPQGASVDAAGNVYFADTGNNAVKEWSPANNSVTVLISNGLSGPQGIAADQTGDLYIADTGDNAVEMWSSSTLTLTNIVTGLRQPQGVAVDLSGNVYIADTGDNDIKEWSAATRTTASLGISGLSSPQSVAVDAAGDVYIADTGNNAVKEWAVSNSTVVTLVGSGLNVPRGVAVDGGGNVYIADSGNNALKEWSPSLGVITMVSSGLSGPAGVAVDSAGNLYIGDTGNNALKDFPHAFAFPATFYFHDTGGAVPLAPIAPPSAVFSFPQFLPTTDSSWITVSRVVNGEAVVNVTNLPSTNRIGHVFELGVVTTMVQTPTYYLGSYSLVEGPAAGLDTVVSSVTPQAGNWSATANASWLHLAATNQSGFGSTNLLFSYDANPGPTRTGTLTIGDQTLTVQQAGSTYVATPPGNTLLISNGLNDVVGITVDNAGDVFAASANNDDIFEWTPYNNNVTQNYAGFYVWDLVSDNSGGVYFVGFNNQYLVHDNSSGYETIVASGLRDPLTGLAADRFGNLYISQIPSFYSENNSSIITEWSASTSSLTNVLSGVNYVLGLAIDASENIYLADANYFTNGYTYGSLQKWTAATGQLSTILTAFNTSGFVFPYGVAVDGSGNVYYTDPQVGKVSVWNAATGQVSVLSTVAASGATGPQGIAVDAQRNVYYSDYYSEVVGELVRAYVDPAPKTEGSAAGSDVLPSVLPASENLLAPFAPSSDQPWLTFTAVNNGVVSFAFTANTTTAPRTAHIILLGETITVTQAATPPSLLNASFVAAGTFQIGLTNINPNSTYTILTTTNLTLALTNWTVLGVASNVAPGLMQFTDTQATNTTRFYTVRSP